MHSLLVWFWGNSKNWRNSKELSDIWERPWLSIHRKISLIPQRSSMPTNCAVIITLWYAALWFNCYEAQCCTVKYKEIFYCSWTVGNHLLKMVFSLLPVLMISLTTGTLGARFRCSSITKKHQWFRCCFIFESRSVRSLRENTMTYAQ